MDNRKRRSNRIDRWLREIGEPERHAPPIDFSEVRCLSQHACCMTEKCPLLRSQPDPGFLRNPTGHATIAPQVASLDPPVRIAKPLTSDSMPTTGSSSSSESLEFTSTESNTELKQSSASSLATSLDSNKMKVIRCELQQQLQNQHQQQSQQQHQQQHQQHQQQQQHQQHQSQHRTRQSCHGASGDNRVDASGVAAPLAPVIRSSSPQLPLPIPPQLPQVHVLQLPALLSPPQLPPPLQLQLPPQQHQPLQPLQPFFATNARESPPRQLPPPPLAAPPLPPPSAKRSTSPGSPVALGEFPSGVCGPSSAAAGVTYYFHLSRHPTSNSGQEQQLLALIRSLHETDPALTHISASRGVSINLGRSVENAAADLASLRRKVVIRGTNWRSVMEAVNDLSLAFPDLMSLSQSTAAAAVAAAAAISGGHAATPSSNSPEYHGQQQPSKKHVVKLPTPPQPSTSLQQPQMPLQSSMGIDRQASPPKKIHRPAEQQPRHSNQHTAQQFHQQPPAQLYQSHHCLPPHQQKSAQPSASTCFVAASTVSSAGYQQGKAPKQQPPQPPPPPQPPLPRQENPRATPKPKLAQNVRFQLTTQQRESLFTQDEFGRPTHPRLKHLLTMLGMDLVFLERSVNQDKVPSVKVRFFFESFDQLTAFCKAIDYQIPTQT